MTSELKERRIVIIGGAGFIGHHLALHLVRQGAHVEAVDGLLVNNLGYFASGNREMPNRDLYLTMIHQRLDLLREAGIPLHVQDARDYHELSRLLLGIKPDVIVHLAAVSHAGRSNKDPMSTFDHSLRTLENALDYARGTEVQRFVYLSSSMAYGNFLTAEVGEDHPLNPIGIYGALKVSGEKIVIAYQQVFDLPYTIIRPSALYGPRCVSRRVGQVFIETALTGGKLRVDGDGKERLDFTYIDDLVDGIGRAIASPGARNEIFNMTNGDAHSILELVEVLKKEFPNIQIECVERDNLMPIRGTLSIDKARRLLGYFPKNDIDIGIPKYVSWYHTLNVPAVTTANKA